MTPDKMLVYSDGLENKLPAQVTLNHDTVFVVCEAWRLTAELAERLDAILEEQREIKELLTGLVTMEVNR